MNQTGVQVHVRPDGTLELPTGTDALTWVTAGDSITAGVVHTSGERNWPEHLKERLYEIWRANDMVLNTGVSGWRVTDLLPKLEERVLKFDPDIVIVSLGTNDAKAGVAAVPEFIAGMTEVVSRIREVGALVILATPVLRLAAGEVHAQRDYAQAVRDVAHQQDVLLIDHEGDWIEFWGDDEPAAWMNDTLHPNGRGHRRMARHLLQALGMQPRPEGPASLDRFADGW